MTTTIEHNTKVRAKMVATLDPATDTQLIEMHDMAFALLRATPDDQTGDITATLKVLSVIETQFERRGIPHCFGCGRPSGNHDPDFCSEVAGRVGDWKYDACRDVHTAPIAATDKDN
jgi:hypothetical protein